MLSISAMREIAVRGLIQIIDKPSDVFGRIGNMFKRPNGSRRTQSPTFNFLLNGFIALRPVKSSHGFLFYFSKVRFMGQLWSIPARSIEEWEEP
jgi:hypothetical protein